MKSVVQAIISIHDVMPDNLVKVSRIIDLLRSVSAPEQITLLVVPGCDWKPQQITTLQQWDRDGFALAGHGWFHHCAVPRTVFHHLHSATLSRRAAEHLSLNDDAIEHLLWRNYQWFAAHDLSAPKLYVPPAWAMGHVSRQRLDWGPFAYYEMLGGIYEVDGGRLHWLPLAGYEADNDARRRFLTFWNGWQKAIARVFARPVRVAIHPDDLNLSMADELRNDLRRVQPIAWDAWA